MIRALVLDCGGVVCRPRRGHWLLPTNMEEILGGPVPALNAQAVARAHAQCAHYLDEGQLVTGEGHEIELRLAYARAMNRLLETGYSESTLLAIAESLTFDDSRYQLYGDVRAFFPAWAQRYRLGVLSNAMPSLARALCAGGLSRYLRCMTISTLCGAQKPERPLYEICLRELGAAPEETVFVDDLEANLLTAESVGMRAVRMARDVYTQTDERPAFTRFRGPVARDFAQLDALLTHDLA